MNLTDISDRKQLWNQEFYVRFLPEIDPFRENQYFRPLDKAYNGDSTFWNMPSPEPDLDHNFWEKVHAFLDDERIRELAVSLAENICLWEPDGNRLMFAAILRAGVPVADWLCRLLPGAAAAAISLFVGLGIDQAALRLIRKNYPERRLVFVDGWTGRGGVAREIAKIGAGPLAVLIDPWGWADFSGTQEDIFCPAACFTGAATMGFSRTFYADSQSFFAAYLFPQRYCKHDLVKAWQKNCPSPYSVNTPPRQKPRQEKCFFMQSGLRLHSNEVCRAMINAAPETLYFFHDAVYVKEHYPLLLELAERRKVKIIYNVRHLLDYKAYSACELRVKK